MGNHLLREGSGTNFSFLAYAKTFRSSGLRGGSFLTVLVERSSQILRDIIGGPAFDPMALEHVHELPFLNSAIWGELGA